ncbi:TetR/AcrR family transcriptional regulator [Myceligenerans crystallogenes]|uniref:TetR family transcriptional regulator n=1 Tax=Myceligenerans crystallogenes TaxID=316335 RepID=A0ABN2NHV7_9MICO
MTFQRARNDEQRAIRRRAILDTAATMLDEMPVADVSLNELSRRAGLAKSALVRYFESREAVLLELLDHFLATWLEELPGELAFGVNANLPAERRAARLAEVLSASLAARPVLCDLFAAQGAVLEHNVSLEVALRHKRASLEALATLTGVVRRHLPELGDDGARTFCLHALVLAGALSAYCPPPAAVQAVYDADPSLEVLRLDLREALQLGLESALLGTMPR